MIALPYHLLTLALLAGHAMLTLLCLLTAKALYTVNTHLPCLPNSNDGLHPPPLLYFDLVFLLHMVF